VKLLPVLLAVVVSALLVVAYAAAGGTSYAPSSVADPCAPRELPSGSGVSGQIEQIVLRAADGVACEIGVSREDLVLSLRSSERFHQLADANGIDEDELETTLRQGLVKAIDQAEEQDAIGSDTATSLKAAVGLLPLDLLLEIVRRGAGILS
jgi:hypothetical protein